MHLSNRAVAQKLFFAVSPDGTRYTAVICDDRRLGILRDDILIPELTWSAEESEECVMELLRLAEVNVRM